MLTALALAVAAPAAEEIVLREGEALAAAVAARDAEFFAFEGCDPDGLQDMLAADFEMYPDRGAVVATAAEPFVREYREACVARRAADALALPPRARRRQPQCSSRTPPWRDRGWRACREEAGSIAPPERSAPCCGYGAPGLRTALSTSGRATGRSGWPAGHAHRAAE